MFIYIILNMNIQQNCERAAPTYIEQSSSQQLKPKINYAEQVRNSFSLFLKDNEQYKINQSILQDQEDQLFQMLLEKIQKLTRENKQLKQKLIELQKLLQQNKKTLSRYIPPNNSNENSSPKLQSIKKEEISQLQNFKKSPQKVSKQLPQFDENQMPQFKPLKPKRIKKRSNTYCDFHQSTTIEIPSGLLLQCCGENSEYCEQLFRTYNRFSKKDSLVEQENLLQTISIQNKQQKSSSNQKYKNHNLFQNVPRVDSIHEKTQSQNMSENNELSSFFANSYKVFKQEQILQKKFGPAQNEQLINFSKNFPDTVYRAFYCLLFILQKPIKILAEIMNKIKKDKIQFLLPYQLKDNQIWINTVQKFINEFQFIVSQNVSQIPDIHIFSEMICQNPLIDKLLIQILKYSIKDKISTLLTTEDILRALSKKFSIQIYCFGENYQFFKRIPNPALNNSLSYSPTSSICNFPKLYQQINIKLSQQSDKFILKAYEDPKTLTNLSPLIDQDQYFSKLEMHQKCKNVTSDQNVIRTKQWEQMNDN